MFYSKRNYYNKYKLPKEDEKYFKERPHQYHLIDYSQKPYTYHVYPLIDRMFMDRDYYWDLFAEDDNFNRFYTEPEEMEKLKSIKRYKFTFLFETTREFDKICKHLVIDKRFVSDLVRRMTAIKLNKIGIHTRQFYSEDMERIFMVLKCQGNVLRTRAEVSDLAINEINEV